MPPVNSPRSPKYRSPPSQSSCTRNSQPIQPLKLPSFRFLKATFSVDHPTSPAHSLQNSALDERVADPIRKKRRSIRQPRKLWEWSLIGLVAIAGIFGGISTSAMLRLSSLPPLPRCEEMINAILKILTKIRPIEDPTHATRITLFLNR